jgi:hypothetical protein
MAQTSELLGLLSQALGGRSPRTVGSLIGADEERSTTGLAAALPLLLAALARNTETPDGASSLFGALARDHDGSALDDPEGSLRAATQDPTDALGILGHVLGPRVPQAQQAVAKASGLDTRQAGALLAAAAPIVLAALGRMQRQRGLDATGTATLLGGERQRLASNAPGLLGMAQRVLDRDGDGDVDAGDLAAVTGALGPLLRG